MGKELEALVCLKRARMDIERSNCEYNVADYLDTIEAALLELKSIKEANPSEALKMLERLKNQLFEYFKREGLSTDSIKYYEECTVDTIKQALLKAQEPKQYLKWEDLEFKKEEQTMKVRLNGTEYDMKYFDTGDFEFIMLQNDKYNAVAFSDYCNKQFFNDLHLERVEE